MGVADIEHLLVAAILHDIGHYPLAHDLEEVDRSIFGHETRSIHILDNPSSEIRNSLSSSGWNIDLDRLKSLIGPRSRESLPFRDQVLRSILNGPIDADKLGLPDSRFRKSPPSLWSRD